MRLLTSFVSAVVEAWGEVRVQRTRVILSLVGVTAAVAAMATVMALGDLQMQSFREMMDAGSGRPVTLTVTVNKTSTDSSTMTGGGGAVEGFGGASYAWDEPATSAFGSTASDTAEDGATGVVRDEETFTVSPVSRAIVTVAHRLDIPYWSRLDMGDLTFAEVAEAKATGTFRGRTATFSEWGPENVQVFAVDPSYATIYRLQTTHGRWLRSGDVNQRVLPVVINSVLWDMLGNTPVEDPLVLHPTGTDGVGYRVVGVVPAESSWDSPRMYAPFDGWQMNKAHGGDPAAAANSTPSLIVWVGEDQVDQARDILPSAVASALGPDWTGSVTGGENFDMGNDELATFRTVIMSIGGIVIFLGALGLLNVAIVTVGQRIREIGIRRAMGASATRVFFSVFMESVVATIVAGVLGVMIAVVAVRLMPLESMGITLQDMPPFPMSAAIAGVGIASSVGALCGIIPAIAAVRVKPIDAIRH